MRNLFFLVILVSYQLYAGIGVGYSNNTPLPVQLVMFSASISNDGVVLRWTTATEINNFGFEIERAVNSGQSTINKWEKVGFVNGSGSSNSKKDYTFTDNNGNNKYVYRLKQIDNNGKYRYSPVIEADGVYNLSFKLEQNYPNPFNPSTVIAYQIPSKSMVTIKIFDMLGREIVTLVNSELESGQYSVSFNGREYSSGVYYYEIIAGEYRSIKKMSLIK